MGTKLYIQNLTSLIDSSALSDMFSIVGEVRNAEVKIKSTHGQETRFGYVEMSTRQEALDGIDCFHGQKKHGSVLIVIEDRPHLSKRPTT